MRAPITETPLFLGWDEGGVRGVPLHLEVYPTEPWDPPDAPDVALFDADGKPLRFRVKQPFGFLRDQPWA